MDTILLKYHSDGKDYLIYDICRNDIVIDRRSAEAICERNFGTGAAGILAGAVLANQELWLRFFRPDGTEQLVGREELRVYANYLRRAGYPGIHRTWVREGGQKKMLEEGQAREKGQDGESGQIRENGVQEIGKLYLSEQYIRKRRMRRAGRICSMSA